MENRTGNLLVTGIKNSVDTENPVLTLQSDAGCHFLAGISQSLAGDLKTDDRRVNTSDSS
jgi:hypothetical protein